MKKNNIVIIGAKNYTESYLESDYKTWNNPKQACYSTLYNLKKDLEEKGLDCIITCVDYCYYDNKEKDINYFNDRFILGETTYIKEDYHNIFIEFVNLLDENYITGSDKKQYKDIIKYKNYKLSWISCGCSWDQYFPSELVNIVIDKEYYTPIDALSVNSFLTTIQITESIIINDIEHVMSPFSQGIYQILGTLMWRGYSKDYSPENVLIDLFEFLDADNLLDETLKKFANREIHWNQLDRKTRLKYTRYIYGNNIKIDL